MSEENKMTVWEPSPFEKGSDLLPVGTGCTDVGAPAQPVVGRESVEPEDLILPTLALLQSMSEAVQEQVDGAKAGAFQLSSAGQFLEAPLRLLLVHHSRSRAMFPKEDQPGYEGLEVCLARDAVTGTSYGDCDNCAYREWREGNMKPLCAESHNFVAMTNYGPAVLRFAKTSFKAAKSFITTWTMGTKNLWAHPAVVTVKQKPKQLPSGKTTTYFVMDMAWDQREDVPPEMQQAALDLFTKISEAHEHGRFASDMETRDVDE